MSDRRLSDWMPPTLVEWMVIIAILGTLVVLLMPAFSAARAAASRSGEPPRPQATRRLETVTHDGHLWVISSAVVTVPSVFVHHPDCQCSGKVER